MRRQLRTGGRDCRAGTVHCTVSDRLVLRIDVESGTDSAAASHQKGADPAEQAVQGGDGSDSDRNLCLYCYAVDSGGPAVGTDAYAGGLFFVLSGGSGAVYAVRNGGEELVSAQISGVSELILQAGANYIWSVNAISQKVHMQAPFSLRLHAEVLVVCLSVLTGKEEFYE